MQFTDGSSSKVNESIPMPIPASADIDPDISPVNPEEEPEEESEDSDIEEMICDPEFDDPDNESDTDELLSAVFTGDKTDEANQADLMTVVVDYAFKRGKIKKNIKKTCHKLIKKYSLELEGHDAVRSFMADRCKPFIRDVFSEYGENPDQALEIAYLGAIWLVLAYKQNMKGLGKNKKEAWAFLKKHVEPENLHSEIIKQLQDKKGKAIRILMDYTEKLNVNSLWNSVDDRMKRKLLKGAYVLGTLKALKH